MENPNVGTTTAFILVFVFLLMWSFDRAIWRSRLETEKRITTFHIGQGEIWRAHLMVSEQILDALLDVTEPAVGPEAPPSHKDQYPGESESDAELAEVAPSPSGK